MQKIGHDRVVWKNTHDTLAPFFLPIVLQILVTDNDWEKNEQLEKQAERINTLLVKECLQFQDTIRKADKMIDQAFEKAKRETNSVLPWSFVFQAYDTYGIPVELLWELAFAEKVSLDMVWYEKAMSDAREKSRDATKGKFSKGTDRSAYISDLPPTEYLWYQMVAWEDRDFEMRLLKDFEVDWQRVLVFDKTPFYAEWGWEVGDHGTITLDDGQTVTIKDVQKSLGVYLHFVG